MASASVCTSRVAPPPSSACLGPARISSASSVAFKTGSYTAFSLTTPSLERRFKRLSVRAEEEAAPALSPDPVAKKRIKVAIKPLHKQRVLLRFLWLEKNIGIGLDQVIPGHGTIPLGPYFFWPRKDAWEELKTKLDSKKWISRKSTIILLNQTTDIINLWQQNATNSL